MFINKVNISNLLSFGSEIQPIPLGPLNIIIGPNGSGKSNFIECFSLLRSVADGFTIPIREGGGVNDWLWKGDRKTPVASLEAEIECSTAMPLKYRIAFTESGQRFTIVDESIENSRPYEKHEDVYFYYRYEHNHPVLNIKEKDGFTTRKLKREDVDPEKSIIAQRKDPERYPEITWLGENLPKIKIYREWSFGRYTPPRMPQKADLPNNYLEEDGGNLGLVLNRLEREPGLKLKLLEVINNLYDGIENILVTVDSGAVQVFFVEKGFSIPATRLSDGTLRFLSLAAILLHPSPPPLVCIEEPELGLHPDMIVTVADLLKDASQRTQLIVTTHSDILVDSFTEEPESVLVSEKQDGCTHIRRLDAESLQPWIKKYRLGNLWIRGEIGGTRW